MAAAQTPWAAELLHFWFHKLSAEQWFGASETVDAALCARFGPDLKRLKNVSAACLLSDRKTAQAAILMFDQVPRNLHRNSPRAFAYDRKARQIALGLIARDWHRGLSKSARQFVYLPFMHSESIADQRRSLRLYARLNDPFVLRFARAHYRMIARFGRFPHRNRTLGRASSPLEKRAVAEGFTW